MQFKNFRDLWIQEGRVTQAVRELFFLAGRDIEEEPLSDSVSVTHFWRSAPREQRWDLLRAAPSHIREVLDVAMELGLHMPWVSDDSTSPAEVLVVLPDEYRALRHRMDYGLSEMQGVNHLIMLSSLRPATELEVDVLRQHNVMPSSANKANEVNVASLALSQVDFPVTTQMRSVFSVPNIDGEPAGVEAMVGKLINFFDAGVGFTFVIHQPHLHEVVQVQRALTQNKFVGEANYIAARPLSTTRASEQEITNEYACSLLDEACRVIRELAMFERDCA